METKKNRGLRNCGDKRPTALPHTDLHQLAPLIFQPFTQQNSSDRKKKDAKVRLALPSGISVGV
jgi:hypothetical protein